MKKGIRTALKVLCVVLASTVAVALLYVGYVFLSYYRLEDNLTLEISGQAEHPAVAGRAYVISTLNLGFGAYSADYSFFMDGGEESVARSAEDVRRNTSGAVGLLTEYDPDFLLFQEVDTNADRSWHVDMYALLQGVYTGDDSVWAQNYDSPYLFYPLDRPHGKSVAGLCTFSDCDLRESVRRSLPIDEGLGKLIDLDRCYSVTRIPVEGEERELVLFNTHLTAYTSDPTVVSRQAEMLFGQMGEEYKKGNYVICGGDFNGDLWGDSAEYLGEAAYTPSWAQPLPTEALPEGIALSIPEDRTIPTCRDACEAYQPGHSFVTVIDGFFVSDNITVNWVQNVDGGFLHSDHNPVVMEFSLNR